MSTPEQPATPPLTRKKMREIRNTGSTPVIPPPSDDDAPSDDATTPDASESAPAEQPAPVLSAPLPRPATPPVVSPPPVADSAVDLGVSPLTRRQARQQERIRTASVPVITPEVVAAHAGASAAASSPTFAFPAPERDVDDTPDAEPDGSAQKEVEATETADTDSSVEALFAPAEAAPDAAPADVEGETPASFPWAQAAAAPVAFDSAVEGVAAEPVSGIGSAPFGDLPFAPPALDSHDDDAGDDESAEAKAVVNPLFGAGLLDGTAAPADPVVAELPASFDQLLARSTGSMSASNALIVSQAPEMSPLVAPVTATGEVLITGTFNLPEGLGSTGHAKGTTDGKEIDATLVDGELPSHSSPTPIAASAAVSTSKTPGEVIRPPVPEKGSRLMMSLAITAGVLALALVGVLILAFVTGVF
ncbi:hypothetical protein [Microbacterium yannicii]|uniref:hypothetical protein n=1 Tax=Microbacterium yannicii TaxID=671622 RepID=UPI0002F6B06C|nr:hypothetical protein [Microbacterium yannicii]